MLSQLKQHGVELRDVAIQIENGSELIGGEQRKRGQSTFIKVLEEAGGTCVRIPPRACTWQSDVETFHKIIDEELYDVIHHGDLDKFTAKAYA